MRDTATHARSLAGLPLGTLVLTRDGALPVEHLIPGDRVVTCRGAAVLRGVTVSAARDAAMVAVAEGALGHDRPGRRLMLPAAMRVLVRDWRAKALCGAAQALIPVARLADGAFLAPVTVAEVRLFALDLGGEAVVYAEGVAVAMAPALAEA